MPRQCAGQVSRNVLVDAALPKATKSYTVISHGSVINNILSSLSENNYSIVDEVYTVNNNNAEAATGLYRLQYGNDPDLGMLFAFSNSYNKSMAFRCAVGGYVFANKASVISNAQMSFGRKHTGTSDKESAEAIKQQIEAAESYFNQLLQDKEAMKNLHITDRQFAELLGVLFVEKNLISGMQLKIAADEMKKPTHTYTTDKNSLWTMYNHILVALTKSHPRTWMQQQKLIHFHLMDEFNLTAFDDEPETETNEIPTEDSNQEIESKEETCMPPTGFHLPGFVPKVDTVQTDLEDEIEERASEEPVEMTEEELSSQLYGVDNNPEVVVSNQSENSADKVIINQDDLFNLFPEMINDDIAIGYELNIEGVPMEIIDIDEDHFVLKEVSLDDVLVDEEAEKVVSSMLEEVDVAGEAKVCQLCGGEILTHLSGDNVIDQCEQCQSLETATRNESELPEQVQEAVEESQDSTDNQADEIDLQDIQDVQDEMSSAMEDQVNDTPEITGIPNGDFMSDTDDEPDAGNTRIIQEMQADEEADMMKNEEIIEEREKEDESGVEFLQHQPLEDLRMKAIKAQINIQIEEVFGTLIDFTLTERDDQYNVKLESGETIVFLKSEIDKLAENDA